MNYFQKQTNNWLPVICGSRLLCGLGLGLYARYMSLFKLTALIATFWVRPRAECAKITFSTRVRIAQARIASNVICNKLFVPRESTSDFNPVNCTHCMCSVSSVSVLWPCRNTNQGGIVHYKSPALLYSTTSGWGGLVNLPRNLVIQTYTVSFLIFNAPLTTCVPVTAARALKTDDTVLMIEMTKSSENTSEQKWTMLYSVNWSKLQVKPVAPWGETLRFRWGRTQTKCPSQPKRSKKFSSLIVY